MNKKINQLVHITHAELYLSWCELKEGDCSLKGSCQRGRTFNLPAILTKSCPVIVSTMTIWLVVVRDSVSIPIQFDMGWTITIGLRVRIPTAEASRSSWINMILILLRDYYSLSFTSILWQICNLRMNPQCTGQECLYFCFLFLLVFF